MLGLIDTVALMPFASAAAATSEVPLAVRVGLASSPSRARRGGDRARTSAHRASNRFLGRYRIVRWLSSHATGTEDAWKATVLITLSWLVRACGLFLLLGALGVGLSLPLALLFLCAAAASGALPIAPAGAATQAGAGAAILVASGLSTTAGDRLRRRRAGARHPRGRRGRALIALAWSGGRHLVVRARPAAVQI